MVQGISYKDPDLTFEIVEGLVYKVEKNRTKQCDVSINISGTGSVNVKTSNKLPTSLNDPLLVISDIGLTPDFYTFGENIIANYMKFEPNQAGTRVIVSNGLIFTNLNLS